MRQSVALNEDDVVKLGRHLLERLDPRLRTVDAAAG